MKIAHIIPGSGGSFYCGNCLRDSKFIQAIRKNGVDAIVLPMYLPLFSHEEDKGEIPVFYGAISIYLKQKFPLLRHAPRWFENFLNSGPMLKFAAKMATSTRSEGLENMTISMLMGEEGKQNKELEKMIDWLENHFKADAIHISNALLIGLAKRLKERLKIPIICSLQDEDVWVDGMREEFRKPTWELIENKVADIDVFIAVSAYFASFMKEKLRLADQKILYLHLGVDPADYQYLNAAKKGKNIGYLSRICKENGFDILLDAFILLKGNGENQSSKLYVTGGSTGDDSKFLSLQKQKIKKAKLTEHVFFIEDFNSENRNSFFENISVLSVPVRNGEAFGIYLTEAMAAGIPIVQPNLGAFPEIVEKSKAGIIYQNNNPHELAAALNTLLSDETELEKLSLQARKAVEEKFNINVLAAEMTAIYRKAIENYKTKSDAN